jgi:hypothetical protein
VTVDVQALKKNPPPSPDDQDRKGNAEEKFPKIAKIAQIFRVVIARRPSISAS